MTEPMELVEQPTEQPVEQPVEQTVYNVILDENGYFTGMACIATSRFEGGVDVDALPPTEDAIQMKAYKLVEGAWELDEERYNTLLEEERQRQEEEENRPIEPTVDEQIEQLKTENEMLTATVDSILTEVIPELMLMVPGV